MKYMQITNMQCCKSLDDNCHHTRREKKKIIYHHLCNSLHSKEKRTRTYCWFIVIEYDYMYLHYSTARVILYLWAKVANIFRHGDKNDNIFSGVQVLDEEI